MAFVREHRRGAHRYYELLEGYRDAEGKVHQRHLKWLGKNKTAPPDPVPLEGVDFAEVGLRLMEGKLAPRDVFDLLGRIGKRPVDVADLAAIGIRYDFAQKKLELYLFPTGYHWRVWSGPRRAPRAKPASSKPGPKPGTASSPSKAKPG